MTEDKRLELLCQQLSSQFFEVRESDDAERRELSMSLDVLLQDATVHHDRESCLESSSGCFFVYYSFLQPYTSRADSNRFIDVPARLFATTKYVHEIDAVGHVFKSCVSSLAEHFCFVRIDGDDPITA